MHYETSIINVNSPAAGAAASLKCPPSECWYLLSVAFDLQIDTTAGNRTPVILVDNGAGDYVVGAAAGYALVPPGTGTSTARYTFSHGLAEWDSAGSAYASGPMPTIPVRSGQTVTVHVDGIASADQLSKIVLMVEQRPVVPE